MAAISLPYKTAAGNVPYGEMAGYREDFNPDTPQSTRVLITSWEDRDAFPVAMLGDVTYGGAGDSFNRTIPEKHPDPKFGYCVELRLSQGMGAPLKDEAKHLIKFADTVNNLEGLAVWEATYRPLPYAVLPNEALYGFKGGDPALGSEGGRYISRDIEFGVEVYQLPGTSMKWSDGTTVPEPVPMQRSINTLKYTWHLVPEPIPMYWRICVGRVNDFAFDKMYDPGTLLCMPPEISQRKHTAGGNPYRDIVFSLANRGEVDAAIGGWNYFYRSKSNGEGGWERMLVRTGPRKGQLGPYEGAAFEALFRTKAL